MKIVIGSDHAGFPLKQKVLDYLNKNYEVMDCGCYTEESVDFPDVAKKVCSAILDGQAERGIMFCGTGVGAAIACNKVKGIRASVVHDIYSAHQAVEHDNVQVITLGNQVVGYSVATDLIETFLNARFSDEEDFRRRVSKLDRMDEER